jgi:integrase
MSKTIPSYLLCRNHIWYFRKRIPKSKVHLFKIKEYKRSLNTRDISIALVEGFKLFSLLTKYLNGIKNVVTDPSDFTKLITLNDVKVDGIEIGDIKIEHDSPEQEQETLRSFLSIIQGSPSQKEYLESSPITSNNNNTSSLKLSAAIERYRLIKEDEESFSKSTLEANIAKLETLLEIVQDIHLGKLNFEAAEKVRNTLQKLPSNRNKMKAYRDKSIAQLLDINIPSEHKLSDSTIRNYIEKYSSFMTWCVKREFCDKNHFSGLQISSKNSTKKKSNEERTPWFNDQLETIFSDKIFTELKCTHSYYYWHPLIALHGGQRMNEISQLYLNEIVKLEGVYCFKIRGDSDDQQVKNVYSTRYVPIHSKLIQLGFLKFIKKLKENNEERVFPELKFTKKAKYSAAVSKWFSRFRKTNDLYLEDEKQDFHSFRHNVSYFLKDRDIAETKTADLLGHKHDQITYGRYGMAYPIATIKDVIETLDFEQFLINVKPFC